MLLAIESLIDLFDTLLFKAPAALDTPSAHADNDNSEASEDERRWAAYR